jgi:hypothetical protein
MKILKKISLVYALQVFAVVLLFGYAVSSPVNKTNEAITDGIMPLKTIKQWPVKTDEDSILTGKIYRWWNVNAAKSR